MTADLDWREDPASVVFPEPHDIEAGRIDPHVPGHAGYSEYFMKAVGDDGSALSFRILPDGSVDVGTAYEAVIEDGMLLGARRALAEWEALRASHH